MPEHKPMPQPPLQTEVETKTPVKVNTSLMIVIGIAILAGAGFGLYAAAPLVKNVNLEPIGPSPFLVRDIFDAVATSNWATDWMSLYYESEGTSYLLGDIPHGVVPGTYIDGGSSTTSKPLSARFITPNLARVVAIQTDFDEVKILCFPADSSPFNPKKYYFDVGGSAYSNQELSNRLTNCSQFIKKSFAPSTISSAVISQPYPSFHVNVGLRKDKSLLAYYNSNHSFTTMFGRGMTGSKAPFSVKISGTDETFLLPTRTIQLTTDLGTTTICVPETPVAPSGGEKEYFYDKTGTPYADPLLTQPVTCLPA